MNGIELKTVGAMRILSIDGVPIMNIDPVRRLATLDRRVRAPQIVIPAADSISVRMDLVSGEKTLVRYPTSCSTVPNLVSSAYSKADPTMKTGVLITERTKDGFYALADEDATFEFTYSIPRISS